MVRIVCVRGVLVCAVASLFCSYQLMIQGAPSVMVPQLMSAFHLDVAGIGWLTSSYLYCYLIFQIPAGYLTDRINLTVLLSISSMLMAAACYWFSVSESVWSVFISRSLMGVIATPCIVASLTLACRWMREDQFPAMAGMVEAFAMLGGGLGPIVLPNLLDMCGWQCTMKIVALVGIVISFLILLMVKNAPSYPVSDSETDISGRICSTFKKGEDAETEPFNRMAYAQCCIFGFGLFSIISTFGGLWGIPFFYERFPGQEEAVGDVVGVMFLGAGIGAPLLGWLATRLGSSSKVMMGSSVMSVLLFSALIFCPFSLGVLGVLSFFTGFFSGGYILSFSLAKHFSPTNSKGFYLAIINASMLIAAPVMQPLIGLALEAKAPDLDTLSVQDFQIAFLVLILCQLAAIIVAICLKKHERAAKR
ncbi:MFS transporter [Endozoicomonas ascidiicola]|uniref:MFS transporter n=1 Tax=Endozoicomonas ascidiicola TaxID=1698521 RepID=UPI00083662C8|nr:MFS transporter [Endozoicomonas ascidiicola]